MPTQPDIRQSVYRSALNMAGTAANATVDTIIAAWDPQIGKLFEDRNILLTDGGSITFTGTQVQFTENLKITLNQKISGAVPQVISLGNTSQNFASSGDMWVAVIDRTAGTATSSIILSGSALPAVSNANQEVFLLAKRVDAADGTQRLYWRNGFAQNAGQTLRLGQGGGSGSGVGGGSDLNSLQFRAQFVETFTESTTSAVTAVNGSAAFTNAVYSAAKQMFTISYDASRTMNTTGTAATLSGTPAFTVAAGDVVINISTGEVKKITAISSQTAYTLESAFATNLATASVCVSQTVHTKDIYNYNANATAASIAQAFPSSSFSEIMVDYEDNATTGSNLWTPDVAPFVGFSASTDNSNWTSIKVRSTNETDIMQSVVCSTAGTSLYLRFCSDKTSGSGIVNLLNYEAFMQKALGTTSGSVLWSAHGTTDSSTTPVNATVSVVGGKTTITFSGTNTYAVGLNTGQSQGALDVYLNGQKLPRFVSGSTPAADAYYTEVSGSAIRLDGDYSGIPLDFEIVNRVQIIDSSTFNTTNISQINTSQLKNYIINGAFDLWQRGTSITVANTASTYQADRWYVKNSLGTNGVITYSQTTGVQAGSKFGASVKITTAPTAAQTNGTELYQVIENGMSIELVGNNVSASAYIKALGNVNQVGIQFYYNTSEAKPTLSFGTEQLVTVNSTTFSLGSLLAQNSGTLPTSAGVIAIRIRITGVSTGNTYDLNNGFVVEQAQVNLGGTANAFIRAGRHIQEEVQMCQRFYGKSYDLTTNLASATLIGMSFNSTGTTGNFVATTMLFKASMRAVPTMAYWDGAGNLTKFSTFSSGAWAQTNNVGALTEITPSQSGFMWRASVTNTAPGIHWSADAEI